MKLASHYNKASTLTSLGVLVVAAVVYFFAINYTANIQLDKNLSQALGEAKEFAHSSDGSLQQYDVDQDHAWFKEVKTPNISRRYFDTVYRNVRESKTEPGRAVEDLVVVGSKNYKVTVVVSRAATSSLMEMISIITLVLIASLIIALFVINRFVLNGLWKPFYVTLDEIKKFNVANSSAFNNSSPNDVEEFSELNMAIHDMSARVNEDYRNLKQFTENVSHEFMTPLAVVTAKLDTLIQDETLNAGQLDQINDIYTSLKRSTRLNQSLLLLTKLDNHLITESEPIDLKKELINKSNQFQELAQTKNVAIKHDLDETYIFASKYLVDILLNNLLSNAIRHNNVGGKIFIQLKNNRLTVENTGKLGALNTEHLFERFKKGSESEGTGLGLTLVKNICNYYRYGINYFYHNGLHHFVTDLNVGA